MIASRRLSDTGSAVVLEKKPSWSFIFQGLTVQQGFRSEKIFEDWRLRLHKRVAWRFAICCSDMMLRLQTWRFAFFHFPLAIYPGGDAVLMLAEPQEWA